jgi:YggT family protein
VTSLVAALQFLLWLYSIALLARLVIEYLRMFARTWQPRGLVLVLVETIFTITDPPLRFVRKFVPPLRLGSINLDLSFLVVFFSVSIASRLLGSLFL